MKQLIAVLTYPLVQNAILILVIIHRKIMKTCGMIAQLLGILAIVVV